jgi:RNA polymerase sigma factor (sigma-70 family)
MTFPDSFPQVLSRLRDGDAAAASALFHRYSRRLIALASSQFDTWLRDRADPEGIVQSVYKSLFVRLEQGRLDPDDWEEFWVLLTVITLRKCSKRRQYLHAGRRAAGRLVSTGHAAGDADPLDQAIDRAPTPVEAAMLTDLIEQLLRRYEGPERLIVELSLQGYSCPQIADQLGRSERTVRRVRRYLKQTLRRLYEAID